MPDANEEQELCKSCGFCCDGTLFAHGTIKDEEVLPPGFEEEYAEGKRCFKLPCSHFNRQCTVYDTERPAICGSFQCDMLELSIEGIISFATASELVAKIKAQKDRLNQLLSDYPGDSLPERYRSFQHQHADGKSSAAFKLRHKKLLMEWVLYKTRLKRFHAGYIPTMTPSSDI